MIRIYRETKINNNLISRIRYYTKKIVDYLCIKQDITIVFVSDEEIKKLNKKFFNKDNTTNVISFPINDKNYLGEIYISFDTAKKEAKEWKVSLIFEILYLIIHGILHLIGYDDLDPENEKIMEDKEIEIVKNLNLNRLRKNEN